MQNELNSKLDKLKGKRKVNNMNAKVINISTCPDPTTWILTTSDPTGHVSLMTVTLVNVMSGILLRMTWTLISTFWLYLVRLVG